MNIVFLCTTPFIPSQGGVERITDTLTKDFLQLGTINVRYLWTNQPNPDTPYTFPAPFDVFPEDPVRFEDYLKQYKVDIVINQNGAESSLQSYYPITRKLGVAMISVFHTTSLTTDNDVPRVFIERAKDNSASFKKRLLNGLISLFYFSGGKFLFHHRWASRYKKLYLNTDKVCLLSISYVKNLRQFYDDQKNLQENKYTAIANANTFPAQNINLASKKKQLLFVGRFTSQKNVFDLLKVWEQLHQKFSDWSLILVGDGEARQKAEEYTQTHHLQNVLFEGIQNPKKYYEDSSILCLTSRFEGFPMVLGEAMVHGCIPASYNSYSAIYDIIDDNHNGLIIEDGQIEEFASKLARIMDDDNEREQLAKNAIKKARLFDKNTILQQWLQLFEEVKPQKVESDGGA
ncbi:MAG: glycosyltransferase [Akkermansia sp.]